MPIDNYVMVITIGLKDIMNLYIIRIFNPHYV